MREGPIRKPQPHNFTLDEDLSTVGNKEYEDLKDRKVLLQYQYLHRRGAHYLNDLLEKHAVVYVKNPYGFPFKITKAEL